MSQIELKGCPFCGGKPTIGTSSIRYESACRIRCEGCSVEIISTDPFLEASAKEEAVAKWNTRSLPSGVKVDREALSLLHYAVGRSLDTCDEKTVAAYEQITDHLRSAIGGNHG